MPSGGVHSVFFCPISDQLVLKTVPFDSWKDFIIALLVSSSPPAKIFLKKAFNGSPSSSSPFFSSSLISESTFDQSFLFLVDVGY